MSEDASEVGSIEGGEESQDTQAASSESRKKKKLLLESARVSRPPPEVKSPGPRVAEPSLSVDIPPNPTPHFPKVGSNAADPRAAGRAEDTSPAFHPREAATSSPQRGR